MIKKCQIVFSISIECTNQDSLVMHPSTSPYNDNPPDLLIMTIINQKRKKQKKEKKKNLKFGRDIN